MALNYSTQHSFKLLPKHFLFVREFLCAIILFSGRWVAVA